MVVANFERFSPGSNCPPFCSLQIQLAPLSAISTKLGSSSSLISRNTDSFKRKCLLLFWLGFKYTNNEFLGIKRLFIQPSYIGKPVLYQMLSSNPYHYIMIAKKSLSTCPLISNDRSNPQQIAVHLKDLIQYMVLICGHLSCFIAVFTCIASTPHCRSLKKKEYFFYSKHALMYGVGLVPPKKKLSASQTRLCS